MATRSPDAREFVALALDVSSARDALQLTDRLEGQCRWVKVGLQLYLAAGQAVVEQLAARGLHVFLDLKLHDIPNTVAGAVRSLASSGAALLTVHACGGDAMLRAASEAASESATGPALVAVTVLTSMNAAQLAGIGVAGSAADQVLRLARLATAAGLPSLVCSPQEVAMLRNALGTKPMLIVPGIRPTGEAPGDQSRIATPTDALRAGASLLVVGRPIIQAADPAQAMQLLLQEVQVQLNQSCMVEGVSNDRL